MAGFNFGILGDTNVRKSTAMSVKWSGDIGGTLIVGLSQSDGGGKSETSMLTSVAMSGFNSKFIHSTNDNGKAVPAVTKVAAVGNTSSYVAATAAVANEDIKTTGLRISYNLDALTITAFSKDLKTKGIKDKW